MSTRLAPLVAGPPLNQGRRRSAGRWARSWTVGISVLLHLLLLAALLTVAKRPEESDQGAPPSYQLMFESPGNNVPPDAAGRPDTTPPPTPAPATPPVAPPPPPAPPVDDAVPGPVSPPPAAPPTPTAPVQPPVPVQPQPQPPSQAPTLTAPSPEPPPPVPQPSPAVPAAPPTQAQPAPAPPADATVTPEPAPLPPPASPPQVRLEAPEPEAPPPPLVPDLALPTPPLPSPPPPVPQRPRTAPPPRALAGTFGNPMDLNFGPSASRAPAARVGAPRGSVASRSVDLSPGAPKGPNHAEAFFDARAARLGTDWQEALKIYWLNHRYYPQQAADDGEDGTVDLELTVASTGRVQSAVLKSRSGSQFIDMAAIGTWRNAQLPPLPPELGEHYTFTITINYILLR